MLCSNDEVKQFVYDFSSAYRQVAAVPALAGLAGICQWSPKWRYLVFFVGRTYSFGGKICPKNFARVPDYWCLVMASLSAMGISHCVDNMPVAERVATISSGCNLGRCVVALAGWVMLHALNRRQHEGGQHNLNPQLKSCIIWWIRHLPVLLARPVPINMEERRFMFFTATVRGSTRRWASRSGLKGRRWPELEWEESLTTCAHMKTANGKAIGITSLSMLKRLGPCWS